jgi:hypothetical protein
VARISFPFGSAGDVKQTASLNATPALRAEAVMAKAPLETSRRKKAVIDAASAHSRLYTFYAVIELLEGTMPGGCRKASRTASSIVKQCKRAAQVQLEIYDAAVADAIISKDNSNG